MEFRILGPLEIVGDEGPIALHRGKEQALLAYFLLHPNEIVPAERLIDELWDEQPPTTAAKIVQNGVSQLRRALGDARIETKAPGYLFHLNPGELDAEDFERLAREGRPAEALALWRGTPLLELRDERFADDARRRLEDARLGVLEQRIDADLANGRHRDLVPELEQLVAHHPLRERLHAQLMRALYASGRQAEALDAYGRARRSFADELGLEPGPELQELERKILQQDPELVAHRRSVGRGNSPGRRRVLPVLVAGVLLLGSGAAALLIARRDNGGPLIATKNSLAVVDLHSKRVTDVLPIGDTPRGVTVGERYVWAANAGDGTVSQIDPTQMTVHTIGLGLAATDIAEMQGSVWVATGADNVVVRLDARTGGVIRSIPISSDGSGNTYAVAAGARSLWIGSTDAVYELNPASEAVAFRHRFAKGGGIQDLRSAGRSLWAVTAYEHVAGLSQSTGRVTAETNIASIPLAVAVGGGSVWVAAEPPRGPGSMIWRLDPVTLVVTDTTYVSHADAGGTPQMDVAFGDGAVWVSSYDAGTVVRVEPHSGDVTDVIRVGGHPSGIAVGRGKVWVTVS